MKVIFTPDIVLISQNKEIRRMFNLFKCNNGCLGHHRSLDNFSLILELATQLIFKNQ